MTNQTPDIRYKSSSHKQQLLAKTADLALEQRLKSFAISIHLADTPPVAEPPKFGQVAEAVLPHEGLWVIPMLTEQIPQLWDALSVLELDNPDEHWHEDHYRYRSYFGHSWPQSNSVTNSGHPYRGFDIDPARLRLLTHESENCWILQTIVRRNRAVIDVARKRCTAVANQQPVDPPFDWFTGAAAPAGPFVCQGAELPCSVNNCPVCNPPD